MVEGKFVLAPKILFLRLSCRVDVDTLEPILTLVAEAGANVIFEGNVAKKALTFPF